jgi:hypothetical protein
MFFLVHLRLFSKGALVLAIEKDIKAAPGLYASAHPTRTQLRLWGDKMIISPLVVDIYDEERDEVTLTAHGVDITAQMKDSTLDEIKDMLTDFGWEVFDETDGIKPQQGAHFFARLKRAFFGGK